MDQLTLGPPALAPLRLIESERQASLALGGRESGAAGLDGPAEAAGSELRSLCRPSAINLAGGNKLRPPKKQVSRHNQQRCRRRPKHYTAAAAADELDRSINAIR